MHALTTETSAQAPIHPHPVVGAGQEIGEGGERLGLEIGRQFLGQPTFTDLALRATAIAIDEQHPSQREPAFRANRVPAQEATHDRGVAPLLPQGSLRAPAQQSETWPAGIVADERRVAVKIGEAVLGAQDCPFDEFLRRGIADRLFELGGFVRLSLAHQFDGQLDRLEVGRRGGVRRGAKSVPENVGSFAIRSNPPFEPASPSTSVRAVCGKPAVI